MASTTPSSPPPAHKLARVGAATAADVHKAAEAAAQAQRDWAALPYDQRAAVLRRAGQLFVEHEDEIHDWLIRESGAIRPFARFQTRGVAAEECWEAAALASHPYGELLRSNQPRLSMARRLPVGVVGVIAPFNAPIILAIRAIAPALALGNAVICKPDPRTAVCGGVVFARIFEEAGLPPGVFHMLPGGADVGAAVVDDPLIRVIAFTGSTRAGQIIARGGRRAAQAGAPGAGRQLGADRARRRRPGEGGVGGRVRVVQPRRARSAWPPAGTWSSRRDRRRLRGGCWPSTPTGCRSATRPATTSAMGPIIDAKQRDNVHRVVTASVDAGRDPARGRHLRGPVLPADGADRRAADRPRVRGGDLRPGRAGRRLLRPRRGGRSWPTAPSTGCRWASSPGT